MNQGKTFRFLALIFILVLGCQPSQVLPNTEKTDNTSDISPSENNVSIQKKNSPPPNEIVSSLAPQFLMSHNFMWLPSKDIDIQLTTQLQDKLQLFAYEVKNPLTFLSLTGSLSKLQVPHDILSGLAKALHQKGIEDEFTKYYQQEAATVEFSLAFRKNYVISGDVGKWHTHTISLDGLSEGLYLLEGRMGPQASYSVLLVSSLQIASVFSPEKLLLYSFGDKDYPVFFQDSQGQWQSQKLKQGVLEINRLTSPWVVIWKDSIVHAIPIEEISQANKVSQIWTDRSIYHISDTIHTAWAFAAETLVLKDNTGRNIVQEKLESSQRNFSFKLPEGIIPGNLRLILETPQDKQSVVISIKDEQAASIPYEKISLARNVFAQGELIEAQITSFVQKDIQLFLYRQEQGKQELVEQQTRRANDHQAKFFMQVNTPGNYLLKTLQHQLPIAVYDKSVYQNHPLLEKSQYLSQEPLKILMPQKFLPQIAILRDNESQDFVYQIVENTPMWQAFSWPQNTRNATLQAISVAPEGIRYDNFAISLSQNPEIQVQTAGKIYPQQDTLFSITSSQKFTEIMAWAVAGDHTFTTQYDHSHWQASIKSTTITIPSLHRTWVEEQISQNYSIASVAYQQQDYLLTQQLCHEILKLSPKHDAAIRLFQKAQTFKSGSFLANVKIRRSIKNMHIADFFAMLSQQSGEYIELDTRALEMIPREKQYIEHIPAPEEALNAFRFVLETRNLVLKEEFGVYFITHSSIVASESFLNDFDAMIDSQLQYISDSAEDLPQDKQHLYQLGFWSGWQAYQNNCQITGQFPSYGMWTIFLVAKDGDKLHRSRQTIWVYPQ